jgi:multidrug efflux pump subunit AcrA (membrane-fusion protein)
VGEVLCVIDNPGGELLPGTNVNVEIQAEVIPNALTIPKEAVRHELGQTGVYTLSGQTAAWKKVELGVASTTRTQVEGLKEGDAVALASAKPLRDGMIVNPQFP